MLSKPLGVEQPGTVLWIMYIVSGSVISLNRAAVTWQGHLL